VQRRERMILLAVNGIPWSRKEMTDLRRDECCAEWKKETLPLSGGHLLIHINNVSKNLDGYSVLCNSPLASIARRSAL